jgi:hypothetical protein
MWIAFLEAGFERFDERLIRQSEGSFAIAVADQRLSARPRDETAELIANGGLTYARLADQHHQRAMTPRGGVERCLELSKFTLSADKRRGVG